MVILVVLNNSQRNVTCLIILELIQAKSHLNVIYAIKGLNRERNFINIKQFTTKMIRISIIEVRGS